MAASAVSSGLARVALTVTCGQEKKQKIHVKIPRILWSALCTESQSLRAGWNWHFDWTRQKLQPRSTDATERRTIVKSQYRVAVSLVARTRTISSRRGGITNKALTIAWRSTKKWNRSTAARFVGRFFWKIQHRSSRRGRGTSRKENRSRPSYANIAICLKFDYDYFVRSRLDRAVKHVLLHFESTKRIHNTSTRYHVYDGYHSHVDNRETTLFWALCFTQNAEQAVIQRASKVALARRDTNCITFGGRIICVSRKKESNLWTISRARSSLVRRSNTSTKAERFKNFIPSNLIFRPRFPSAEFPRDNHKPHTAFAAKYLHP